MVSRRSKLSLSIKCSTLLAIIYMFLAMEDIFLLWFLCFLVSCLVGFVLVIMFAKFVYAICCCFSQ